MIQFIIILLSSFFLFGCNSNSTPTPTPTPSPKIIELSQNEKPIVSLIPRTDGHEIKLKIENIPPTINQIEYELLYTAVDNNMEIEKGAGDTIKLTSQSVERNLLLGTSSCTNGCKYKYDNGVTGGTLSLTLITNNNQIITFETPFTLKTGKDIKKANNTITLPVENYSQTVSNPKPASFYLLLKNFGSPDGAPYKLFESGSF